MDYWVKKLQNGVKLTKYSYSKEGKVSGYLSLDKKNKYLTWSVGKNLQHKVKISKQIFGVLLGTQTATFKVHKPVLDF